MPCEGTFPESSIPDMPKPCKRVDDARKRRVPLETIVNRYLQTHKRLDDIEIQLSITMSECQVRTGCFLRWGPWCLDYTISLPFGAWAVQKDKEPFHYEGIEEWQVILAEFYAEEATRLVREREEFLKQLYALTSEIYEREGRRPYPLSSYYSRWRKPWFRSEKKE